MKPRLLIAIYANPDYYPPTVNAVRILAGYFDVYILARNLDPPVANYPAAVTVERCGEYGSAREKESAPPAAKLAEYARFIASTRRTIAGFQPDAIYAYDHYAMAAVQLAGASRRAIPTVFHMHELVEPERVPPRSLQRRVARVALRATRRAAAVVFPEKFRARFWMDAAGDPRQAFIVPNCPPADFFPAPADWNELIARRYRAREALYLGYVGEENGHLDALRALALLDASVRMRVIGAVRPEFETRFNALALQLKTIERVDLARWPAQAELLSVAARATLGLSLYRPVTKNLEFMGSASNKLFQYAALGLPVVLTDCRSNREFLGAAQWVAYADAGDPESIARAVSSILADRERYIAMSLAARRAFEQDYNYERVFQPALRRLLELAAPVREDRAPNVISE